MDENNSEDSLEFIIDHMLNPGGRREKGNVSSVAEVDSYNLHRLHSNSPMEESKKHHSQQQQHSMVAVRTRGQGN